MSVPDKKRNYGEGADILQRVTGNAVRYREMMRKGPENFAGFINKKLGEILEFRLAKLTHAQVSVMKAKADKIVEQSGNHEDQIRSGKREDHDSLPDEIKAAYVEALDCLRMVRELQLQIRNLALGKSRCPDSEVYPFVKEIIKVDDKRLALWKKYDEFRVKS